MINVSHLILVSFFIKANLTLVIDIIFSGNGVALHHISLSLKPKLQIRTSNNQNLTNPLNPIKPNREGKGKAQVGQVLSNS